MTYLKSRHMTYLRHTIMHLTQQFFLDWFNHPEWWFACNDNTDNLINERYGKLLEFNWDESSNYCVDDNPLLYILAMDQLPRHALRHQHAHHVIEWYLCKALNCHSKYSNTKYETDLPPQQWCFFMLPLRHTNVPVNIMHVIYETWKRMESQSKAYNKDELNVYKRFLRATISRFDTNEQSHFINYCNPNQRTLNINNNFDSSNLLDFSPSFETWGQPICYQQPTSLNIELQPFAMHPTTQISQTSQTVVISLSGGVDSMVCSHILSKRFAGTGTKVIAVHINYTNRCECDLEVAFLTAWCNKLNMPLYVRAINEMKRAACMEYELRDLYESYTRDVRYGTYITISRSVNTHTHNNIPVVVLAHNRDDCFENIMTNVAHTNKYENLKGMTTSCVQNGIEFLRPLLNASKNEIISYAHHNNIPYLPDSTPSWSQRGQIRKNIVPVLDEWDQRFVHGMFVVGDTMRDLYNILHVASKSFIAQGIKPSETSFECIVDVEDLQTSSVFWREVLNILYNEIPSIKSLNNLSYCLTRFKAESSTVSRKVLLSKSIHINIAHKRVSQVVVSIMKI